MIKKFVNADIKHLPWLTGYLAIVIGGLLTFVVQSSSVFTSTLTPLVGLGLIDVDRMYPMVIGSNLGTTSTALIAAFASGKTVGLQIALCHFFFNLSGILAFFSHPFDQDPSSSLQVAWKDCCPLQVVCHLLLGNDVLRPARHHFGAFSDSWRRGVAFDCPRGTSLPYSHPGIGR